MRCRLQPLTATSSGGIHHVRLHTSDLNRLKSFYEAAFGFQMIGREVRLADVAEAALITGVPGAARNVMLRAHNAFLESFQCARRRTP